MAEGTGEQEQVGIGKVAGPFSAAGLGVAGPVLFLTGVAAFAGGFTLPLSLLISLCVCVAISVYYWKSLLPLASIWLLFSILGYVYASFRSQLALSQIHLPQLHDAVSFNCVSDPYPSRGGMRCLAQFQPPHRGRQWATIRPGWLSMDQKIQGVVVDSNGRGLEIEAEQSIVGDQSGLFQAARSNLAEKVRAIIPDPQASLILGSVFGRGLGFNPQFKQKMIRSGTIHLVAVSGYNIVVLAGLLKGVGFFLTGPILRLLFTNGLIWLFVLFAGAPVSAVRAAVMFTAGELSFLAGRGVRPITGITMAAAILAIWEPSVIADAGFLLSFASICGLSIFTAPLSNFLSSRFSKNIAKEIAPSLAAQLGVLPVTVLVFGRISAASIPANLAASVLIQPLFVISVLANLLALSGAGIIAWLIGYPFASLMVGLVEIFSRVPQISTAYGGFGTFIFLVFWLVVSIALIRFYNEKEY